ncbi:penicillin-binding transpeptidase domain-containing protein [Cellulosilyticum ruminicola]|uniref:penicillin-binding transpeptidase domain-containing protein n=1 Tax=Cellulosilyticum ruminicola TaxID=425254 RepID=UPI0006CF481B|nr:penicillin-binding transpeptidase domain-containing protein [Cellulosilyticum ruminicola]
MNSKMRNKILSSGLVIGLLGSALVGCGQTQNAAVNSVGGNTAQTANQTAGQTINQEAVNDEAVSEVQQSEAVALEGLEDVDYSSDFEGINGCAVFYCAVQKQGQVYNMDIAQKEASHCSTFKIVSTLMGLHEGVLKDVNTTMGYDGKNQYPFDAWNTDLNLKDAFASSCVWYFRKVIDGVGQEKTAEMLKDLGYGNCDISQWQGSGTNGTPDLDGFWLESSLKISPMEQVQVLVKIFEEQAVFTEEERSTLKDVMLVEENEGYKVYGKTGTGYGDNAWFVGFVEKNGENEYFALRLNEESLKGEKSMTITGGKAKEIALKIIANRK